MNKQLKVNLFFPSLVYFMEKPEWIETINKISNEYIEKAKRRDAGLLQRRKDRYGNIGDHGMTFHSASMIEDIRLKNFKDFITENCVQILENQGYDLTEHLMRWTELWVQEFGKNGGGHHDTHIHGNNHMSGFYFLQCSHKTSYPVFHDPRPGKLMTQLPVQKGINAAIEKIDYKIVPGTLMFFNSYLPHQFTVDDGVEPFRFIHFNLQAIEKRIL